MDTNYGQPLIAADESPEADGTYFTGDCLRALAASCAGFEIAVGDGEATVGRAAVSWDEAKRALVAEAEIMDCSALKGLTGGLLEIKWGLKVGKTLKLPSGGNAITGVRPGTLRLFVGLKGVAP